MIFQRKVSATMVEKRMLKRLKKTAETIVALRGSRSQNVFAKELKVSQNYISQLENGKVKPSVEFLFTLSERCDVSIDFILKGKDSIKTLVKNQEGFSGVNMTTFAAKEALRCLEKCSKAIKELDFQSENKIGKLRKSIAKTKQNRG